jgi:hypothetical protein
MRRKRIVIWLAALVASTATHAQAPTPAVFDVASVKANKTGATQVTISWQGGVTLINVPLRAIVQLAYNINTAVADHRAPGLDETSSASTSRRARPRG